MTSQHSDKPYEVIKLDMPGMEDTTVPVHRAGVLLFSPAEKLDDWKILVAKPIPKREGNPPFQLAKGSMKVRLDDEVIDKCGIDRKEIDKDGIDVDKVPKKLLDDLRLNRPNDFETPAAAGLRELREETGAELKDIKPSRILYDGGPFLFTSVSTDKKKAVHMLAAEAADATRTYKFDPGVTTDTAWMSLEKFRKKAGRIRSALLSLFLLPSKRSARSPQPAPAPGTAQAATARHSAAEIYY